MFQPFVKFQPQYIGKLKQLKKTFLVTQTYCRGFNHFEENHKIDILVSDYDDIGLAKGHQAALERLNKSVNKNNSLPEEIAVEREGNQLTLVNKNRKYDKYISIINLNKEEHLNKFREMLQPESDYNVYWAIVQSADDLKKRLNEGYSENMRRYITRFTNWNISSGETVRPQIQTIFGELFIVLKRGQDTLRIMFEALEKV